MIITGTNLTNFKTSIPFIRAIDYAGKNSKPHNELRERTKHFRFED